jgi:dephospho-CoA kinase
VKPQDPATASFVVGLTGGIGSGKSAAAEEFARLGATVVDTDAIAHDLTAAGGAAMPEIGRVFGPEAVAPTGEMDRGWMRARVFSDAAAKKSLEAVLHPMIRAESRRRMAAAPGPYVIHVVPLLVESPDYRQQVDRVLVIDAPEATQMERVRHRGLPEEQIRAIIRSQVSRDRRLAEADDVIDNHGTLDALRKQVADYHARYVEMARARKA